MLDAVTIEILWGRITSIVDEAAKVIIRTSFSTLSNEANDFACVLTDAKGQSLAQNTGSIPSFIGTLPATVRHFLGEFTPDSQDAMQDGDIYITNNPWQGTGHLPDVCVAKPIFHDGRLVGNDAYAGGGTHLPDIVLGEPIFADGRIVAWAVNTAHHADFADRGHAHIYQEGLRIPPIRLYRAGELQEDVQELILLNCQVPRERLSDLRAQMAANRLGVQRMQALCGKYTTDTVLAVGDALQDYAERKMRAGIAALPDGVYRFDDTYDNPELGRALPVSIEVTIAGDEMRLHFDSPPQVRAGINMIYTALLSSVYYAVKAVVDPTILPNSGLARPITVTAPPGTVMNATHPAAVNGRTSTCQRAADLVLGALAQAAPERVTAAGNGACATASFSGADPADGHLWVYLETIGGGSGARAEKDGLDGVHVHMTNTSNLPVEALEVEYPLTVLRYELVDGSGGAGKHRGGMGLRRVYRAEADCRLRVDGSRLLTPPWGLAGGAPGGCGAFKFGGGVEPFVQGRGALRAGQIVEIVTPGAGGYGPPSGD
jgi:N-methylhydantoinase B